MRSLGSLIKAGLVMQSGRSVAVKADGTAEGTIVYECDESYESKLPKLYSSHPKEPALIAHRVDVVYLTNKRIQATYTYHGVSAQYGTSGRSTVEMDGGVDQVPIQTHPKFATFAGTAQNPKNGALWLDASTGQPTKRNDNSIFDGFKLDPSSTLFGMESYLVPRPIITKSFWTGLAPSGSSIGRIVSNIPGAPSPPGIRNWLCVGFSYQQVGGTFKVTEQYKGSPSPGWNSLIYD